MKKGFTLIEMIGVMVILSLLMAFAMPSIINYIKKGGDTKDKVVEEMIYDAAKNYMSDNKNMFKKDEKNIYCISIYTLTSEGYVESPITLSSSDDDITSESSTKTVKVTYDKKYKYELTDECIGIVNPTPILTKGLTPVYYDEENEQWVVANPKTDEWYNYDEQKWANAVVLKNGVTKNVGDTVAVDGTEAVMMYVWIPRYEYKYTNLGDQYAGGTQEQPGEISINFISKETTTPSSDNYKVHPAFTFGTEGKSGMWVGKFELSHTTKSLGTEYNDADYEATNLNCTTDICTETQNLRILPNVPSLRYNDVSNFFYAIKGISNNFELSNIDTHMMKNSEWGAVVYLSQSRYGKYGNSDYDNKYKEVYQNKDSEYITGKSNGTPSQSESRSRGQCAYNDMMELGVDEHNYKMGQCGPGASTTGNIYGAYDMSGGAYEYVMGAYGEENNPTIYESGFSTDPNVFTNGTIDSKYYDIYKSSTANTACDGVCYGHGLSETSGWYGDSAAMVTSSRLWLLRGAYYDSSHAGLFHFYNSPGIFNSAFSTRVVILVK